MNLFEIAVGLVHGRNVSKGFREIAYYFLEFSDLMLIDNTYYELFVGVGVHAFRIYNGNAVAKLLHKPVGKFKSIFVGRYYLEFYRGFSALEYLVADRRGYVAVYDAEYYGFGVESVYEIGDENHR